MAQLEVIGKERREGEEEKKGKRGRRSWSPPLVLHHRLKAAGEDDCSDSNRQWVGQQGWRDRQLEVGEEVTMMMKVVGDEGKLC